MKSESTGDVPDAGVPLADSMEGGLETLLAPCTVAAFADRYWEQQPLYLARNHPGSFDAVFSDAAVDAYLQRGRLRPQNLNVVKDGHTVPTERWTHTAGALKESWVDAEHLFTLFDDGYSLILCEPRLDFPALDAWCRRLEDDLGFPVGTKAILTPPHGQAFVPHYDRHNLFIVQVSGEKHWRLYEPALEAPLHDHRYAPETPLPPETHVLTLHAGDVLYVPGGVPHAVTTGPRPSLHLSVTLRAPRWRDVLRTLAEADPALRHAVPTQRGDAEAIQPFAEALAHQARMLVDEERAVQQAAAGQQAIALSNRPLPRAGRLLARLQPHAVKETTLLRRRPGVAFVVRPTGRRVALEVARKRILLPLALEGALLFIRDQERPFTAAALPEALPVAMRVDLVRRLLREGLLTLTDALIV